ncbi:MAG: sulfite exporter TauE/SafE family protein [Cyanosarcina radialis HA8281-LM2]|jgi:hypothetical protein|nr:sulfite exporter TauE/SafE family protein [Cyanosarcina radialis HA8281-LM2]
MKAIGGIKHWRQQTVDRQVVKWLVMGSVPGAISGVAILHQIKQSHTLDLDGILLRFIGVTILLVTVLTLLQLVLSTMLPSLSSN